MTSNLPIVLIIEDNPDDYEAIERSFIKNNIKNPIKWLRTGKEAYQYLTKSEKYDNDPSVKEPVLIIMDLNMPGMDGKKLLKLIRPFP